ncbi:MAG: iron-containing alcohol dehydrogenase [Candidatus Omnitrophica bacterium]|nr:iron-containing alcohol dehydrogenase [Candidatus Omnitrophota bacterium]
MLNFDFHIPTRVYFGKGRISCLEDELRGGSGRILIVSGTGSVKKNGIYDAVLGQVRAAGSTFIELTGILPNPRLESVYRGIEISRREGVNLVLGVGGGSVIDAAKAIAAGVVYKGDVWDLYEGKAEAEGAVRLGTVLTLAATGSEMNSNSVITNVSAARKLALSSPFIYPSFSIMNPEYTYTVPPYHTAAGVADIMAHIFEHYFVPIPAADVQERISEGLLKVCVKYGPVACSDPRDYDARANLLWASTLALNGTSGKGKTADFTCHMIEHEISAINDMSHGAGLAILLAAFMKVSAGKYGPERLANYGRSVFGISTADDTKASLEAADMTRKFFSSIGLPARLEECGIMPSMFGDIADKAVLARGKNPLYPQLTREDIMSILEMSA